MNKKKIAICIPCFNEANNIHELYSRIKSTIDPLKNYSFNIVFADNCSNDETKDLIEELIRKDSRVGLITNSSNFGFVRSSANILLAPDADANIFLMSDLQDPPELIRELVMRWEESDSSVVFAVRRNSKENKFLFLIKKIYYKILSFMSDYKMVRDTTGFGIYEREVIFYRVKFSCELIFTFNIPN